MTDETQSYLGNQSRAFALRGFRLLSAAIAVLLITGLIALLAHVSAPTAIDYNSFTVPP